MLFRRVWVSFIEFLNSQCKIKGKGRGKINWEIKDFNQDLNSAQPYVASILEAVYFWGNETCIDFREKTDKDGKNYLLFDSKSLWDS